MEGSFKPLFALSPSQFGKVCRCPYQFVVERYLQNQDILPHKGYKNDGAGSLGTIIHKVLERANRKPITDKESFEAEWESCLIDEENKLRDSNRTSTIPLAFKAKNYAVKKLMLQWFIVGKEIECVETHMLGPEKMLADSTGTIKGTADLIRLGPGGGVEIVDYKTGKIFVPQTINADSLIIVEDYSFQLRLYAALFYEQFGEWPENLLLADLAGVEHIVDYTKEDSYMVLQNARRLFTEINNAIEWGQPLDLARPSEGLCIRCSVRHFCEASFC